MMKSSTLFECGPLPSPASSTSCPPDVIHVISVPKPSPFFAALLLPGIIVNICQKAKNGGDLATVYVGLFHIIIHVL